MLVSICVLPVSGMPFVCDNIPSGVIVGERDRVCQRLDKYYKEDLSYGDDFEIIWTPDAKVIFRGDTTAKLGMGDGAKTIVPNRSSTDPGALFDASLLAFSSERSPFIAASGSVRIAALFAAGSGSERGVAVIDNTIYTQVCGETSSAVDISSLQIFDTKSPIAVPMLEVGIPGPLSTSSILGWLVPSNPENDDYRYTFTPNNKYVGALDVDDIASAIDNDFVTKISEPDHQVAFYRAINLDIHVDF